MNRIPSIGLQLVARTLYPARPFTDRETALELWNRLKAAFPDALAAVIMPNHLHLILPVPRERPDIDRHYRQLLGRVLMHFARFFGQDPLWEPQPPSREISGRDHLLRQIRYVHLNPVRAHLVKDPLEWELNTYVDWLDLSLAPWRDFSAVRQSLGFKNVDGVERFHSYSERERHPNPALEVGHSDWRNDMARGLPRSADRIAEHQTPLISWPEVAATYLRLVRASRQELTYRGPLRSRLMAILFEEMNAPIESITSLLRVETSAIHKAAQRYRKTPPDERERLLWRQALRDARLQLVDIRSTPSQFF